jgi:dinuclear metal center YbgI/SA1388 family protein
MVKLKEIKDFLESVVPLDAQDSWDNSGLQVGSPEKEVKTVGFALSVSKSVIEEAREKSVELLIVHHPVAISGVKSLVPYDYPSNLFLSLAEAGISVYALHTNLDVSPFGPTALICEELSLKGEPIVSSPPYGRIGELPSPVTQRELLEKLRSFLPSDVFRVVNFRPDETVRKVAVCSGSGASFISAVAGRAQLFVTGDLKYHDALKAQDLGLTVFDLGHFATERLFYLPLKKLLAESFPSLNFLVLNEKSPFEVV